MEFFTTDTWDEVLWQKIKPIYEASFDHGAKPEKIIRNMFAVKLCSFHVAMEGTKVLAFALTGSTNRLQTLVIDYLAVREDLRKSGLGRELLTYIKQWAEEQESYEQILIEVECDKNPENQGRIHFWQNCGFRLLDDYTHHYIWVPEPYQAMWFGLKKGRAHVMHGGECFKIIVAFHKECFRKKGTEKGQ